ncbi:membrane dipeptidase [Naumannella sp. ID2617S]|nr:membrane dipeptidase [Naumannella sp. ID2617S]
MTSSTPNASADPLVPVVDGHNDLPWALRTQCRYDFGVRDIARHQPTLQTDLPRLRAGGVRAQFWSVFVPGSATQLPGTGDFFADTCEQVDAVHRMVDRYADDLRLVTTPDELDAVLADDARGPIGSLLGAEGGHSIDNSLACLRTLHRLGVRYLTLTHNENNDWADSATDEPRHGGLTDFGREVVAEMNRIGMMVDLSHTAPSTMRDALDVSTAPVIFSHSSARAVNDHPRNVPDDVLQRMAAGGGLCMVTFVTKFVSAAAAEWAEGYQAAQREAGLSWMDREAEAFEAAYRPVQPETTVAMVADHCDHIRELVGIDHLGLGGDFDGTTWLPIGLGDVAGYPRLFAELRGRGWSAADLHQLGAGNIARVFRAVSESAAA